MNGRTADSFTSIHDAPLHHTGGRGKGKDAAELAAPPDIVLQEIDQQELNRMFVRRCGLLQHHCSVIFTFISSIIIGPSTMHGCL